MDPNATTLGLAALAGLLTTLSPCVLPVLPMVAASASGRSRWGLFALALGMAASFTVIGVALSSSGQWLGLDEYRLRQLAGGLMLAIGLVLLIPALQRGMERLTAGIGQAGGQAMQRIRGDGPLAQLGVGALMGAAWSPCVGPTLGAAIALAAQGGGAGPAAVVMAVFSVAAVLPLIAIGAASRALLQRHQQRLLQAGRWGRRIMGASLLLIGALVLTSLDKVLEAWLLGFTPAWLTELTTRF